MRGRRTAPARGRLALTRHFPLLPPPLLSLSLSMSMSMSMRRGLAPLLHPRRPPRLEFRLQPLPALLHEPLRALHLPLQRAEAGVGRLYICIYIYNVNTLRVPRHRHQDTDTPLTWYSPRAASSSLSILPSSSATNSTSCPSSPSSSSEASASRSSRQRWSCSTVCRSVATVARACVYIYGYGYGYGWCGKS